MTITLQCPRCKTSKNDAPRADYDPPAATLYVVPCPDCSVGCKVEGGTYYDARGKELEHVG